MVKYLCYKGVRLTIVHLIEVFLWKRHLHSTGTYESVLLKEVSGIFVLGGFTVIKFSQRVLSVVLLTLPKDVQRSRYYVTYRLAGRPCLPLIVVFRSVPQDVHFIKYDLCLRTLLWKLSSTVMFTANKPMLFHPSCYLNQNFEYLSMIYTVLIANQKNTNVCKGKIWIIHLRCLILSKKTFIDFSYAGFPHSIISIAGLVLILWE